MKVCSFQHSQASEESPGSMTWAAPVFCASIVNQVRRHDVEMFVCSTPLCALHNCMSPSVAATYHIVGVTTRAEQLCNNYWAAILCRTLWSGL